MKKTVFIICLATWNMLLTGQKPLDIIIKNETEDSISVTLDGRVDNYYTHASKKTSSLIPHDEVFYVEEKLAPGKAKEVRVTSKKINKAYKPHQKHLLNQNYHASHKTIRGTLVIADTKAHYDLQEEIFNSQDLTLTVTRDGLTVQVEGKSQTS